MNRKLQTQIAQNRLLLLSFAYWMFNVALPKFHFLTPIFQI